jgi:hypothetical protein
MPRHFWGEFALKEKQRAQKQSHKLLRIARSA